MVNTRKTVDRRRDSEVLARQTRQIQGGAARAAVLGVNDGLVSTVCIILGVMAATAGAQQPVLIAGFAGLVAGAFSMAAGEWISVKAQVELFEGILADLKHIVRYDSPLVEEKLAERFNELGMSDKLAKDSAASIARNEKEFSHVYATQVLGLNPDELGSPMTAALSSFLLFGIGAIISLAPWFFTGGLAAGIWSVVLTAAASLVVGGYIAHSSGKSIVYGSIRQLAIVVFASAITYGVGHLFGVAIG